jgi:large subunit ribosomal protein L15
MTLSNLRPPKGAKHSKKRVGRGQGSGNGLPKRGFHNPFREEFEVVNLDTLAERFDTGVDITPDVMRENGLVTRKGPVKILARGDISKALTVRAHKFSGKAAEKIAAAGGKAELLS